MRKAILLLSLLLSTPFIFAQDNNEDQTPEPNYRLAAKYSPSNLSKLVYSTTVRPNWLQNGNRFWYQYKTTEGSNYYIVVFHSTFGIYSNYNFTQFTMTDERNCSKPGAVTFMFLLTDW